MKDNRSYLAEEIEVKQEELAQARREYLRMKDRLRYLQGRYAPEAWIERMHDDIAAQKDAMHRIEADLIGMKAGMNA